MKKDISEEKHYLGHRERVRERFIKSSAETIEDYVLLELLLFGSYPRQDVKPIAKRLIKIFGSFKNVIEAELNDLTQKGGVSLNAAINFKAIKESCVRMLKEQIYDTPLFDSFEKIIDYFYVSMSGLKYEQFRILFLNHKNILISDEVQQEGTVDHTPIYPRKVIKRALDLGASKIILVHNHPSGDPSPSLQDVDMTKKIKEAGEKIGIQVYDHIIIGNHKFVSLKSMGHI